MTRFLQYTNQVDPAFAQGRMAGRDREDLLPRAQSVRTDRGAMSFATGLVGVSIPVGALRPIAQDGNIYTCTQQGTIPASGNITLFFCL